MLQEIIKTKDIPETIPLRERNEFQITLMQKMIGESASNELMLSWANVYGKKVSDIIDDAHNQNIRSLIMNNAYEDAVKEILELLKN